MRQSMTVRAGGNGPTEDDRARHQIVGGYGVAQDKDVPARSETEQPHHILRTAQLIS